MRTHITVKKARMPSTVNGIQSDLVVPVAVLGLTRELGLGGNVRYTVSTDVFKGWLIEQEEYYRLKKLITDPMEDLDGELAKD
jgi:hypothetical protein